MRVRAHYFDQAAEETLSEEESTSQLKRLEISRGLELGLKKLPPHPEDGLGDPRLWGHDLTDEEPALGNEHCRDPKQVPPIRSR